MRIRSIKPEFFKHDVLASLPPLTRILFVGLWAMADREGRLEDRPSRIKVEVLPYDDFDVEAALSALAAQKFIIRYRSGDAALIQITTFSDHQRINGREAQSFSKFPPPEGVKKRSRRAAPVKHTGSNGDDSGKQPGSLEGKGREGKGISSCPDSSSPDEVRSGKIPDEPLATTEKTSEKPPPTTEIHDESHRFVDWFLALVSETGGAAPKLTPSGRETWADCYDKMLRLDGRTKEQVKAVCRWARNDAFWQKNFLSPAKLRDKKDGVMWFDAFANKMATGSAAKSKPVWHDNMTPAEIDRYNNTRA